MGMASLCSDLTMPISWDACVEIGGSYTATVAATMNMLGNLAGFVMPVVGGLILQKTAGNWAALIHLMIASDVIAALCWLYLNPERAGRQRERERGLGEAERHTQRRRCFALKRKPTWRLHGVLVFCCCCRFSAFADARITVDAAGNWPMPGRDPGGTRYSTADANYAGQCEPAEGGVGLPHEAGRAAAQPFTRRRTSRWWWVQPCTWSPPIAGWSPWTPPPAANNGCFKFPMAIRPRVRGATYWPGGEGAGPAIIFGTRRGRMYSISAATGQLNQEFGDHGMVDLKTPEVMTTGKDKSYILPSPPAHLQEPGDHRLGSG